jgi:putative membrane protein
MLAAMMMHDPMMLAMAHLLLTGVSVLVVARLLPGFGVASYASAVLFAVVLAILNALVWYFLGAHAASSLMTSGLASVVLNGLLFYAASRLVPGVEQAGCISAVLAAIGVSFLNSLMQGFLGRLAP